LTRAKEFNISGVTYSMTQGVVKNIIPAIASTNAIVAASCCNEAFKLATNSNPFLGIPETDNYMMYTGDESVYTYTFQHMKKSDCPVCGNLAKNLEVDANSTLQEFIDSLAERPEAYVVSYPYFTHMLTTSLGSSRSPRFEQRRSHCTTNHLQRSKSRQDPICPGNSSIYCRTEKRSPYRIRHSILLSSSNWSSRNEYIFDQKRELERFSRRMECMQIWRWGHMEHFTRLPR
jgi:hypothetical protein